MDQPQPADTRWDFRHEEPWNTPGMVPANERTLGSLCYVSQIIVPLVMPLAILLMDETHRSHFLRHHAAHALALMALTVLYYLLVALVWVIIALVGGCLACMAAVAVVPPILALIYYGWQAYSGRAPTVPWLTDLLLRNGLLPGR
jgi:uncharacterized membrane protein